MNKTKKEKEFKLPKVKKVTIENHNIKKGVDPLYYLIILFFSGIFLIYIALSYAENSFSENMKTYQKKLNELNSNKEQIIDKKLNGEQK